MTDLAGIFTIDLGLAALVIAGGGIIRGYTGFGGGMLMAPLLTLLYGPVEAFAVMSIVAVFGYAQLYPRAVRIAHWPELAPLLVAIAVFTPVGVAFLFVTDPELVRRFIGVAVLLGALLMLTGWVYRGPRGMAASVAAGALCGGINGIAGAGGPPMVVYFLAAPVGADVQRANILIGGGLVAVMLVVAIAAGGGIGWATAARGLVLLPASMFGTWAGARLFSIAPEVFYRRIAAWLLAAVGLGVIVL